MGTCFACHLSWKGSVMEADHARTDGYADENTLLRASWPWDKTRVDSFARLGKSRKSILSPYSGFHQVG